MKEAFISKLLSYMQEKLIGKKRIYDNKFYDKKNCDNNNRQLLIFNGYGLDFPRFLNKSRTYSANIKNPAEKRDFSLISVYLFYRRYSATAS